MDTQPPVYTVSLPAIPITDPRFVYRPSAATDVQATWRRFGWTPPSLTQQFETHPIKDE